MASIAEQLHNGFDVALYTPGDACTVCGRSQPYAHKMALIQYLQRCQAPSDLALRLFLHDDMPIDARVADRCPFDRCLQLQSANINRTGCSHPVPAKDKLSGVKIASHAN